MHQQQRKPISERVSEIQRRKAENLLQKRMEVEVEQNATFKPAISSNSERIINRKREEAVRTIATGANTGSSSSSVSNGRQNIAKQQLAPANERLYNLSKQRRTRPGGVEGNVGNKVTGGSSSSSTGSGMKRDYNAEETENQHNMKKTAPKTDAIIQNSVFFQGPCVDFIVRQQTFEDARNQRRELRRKIAEGDMKFQPTISRVSEALARSDANRLGETIEQRVERLSTVEQKRRQHLRQKLSQTAGEDCTFRPEINPVSRILATAEHVDADGRSVSESHHQGPVHERLYLEAKERLDNFVFPRCS